MMHRSVVGYCVSCLLALIAALITLSYCYFKTVLPPMLFVVEGCIVIVVLALQFFLSSERRREEKKLIKLLARRGSRIETIRHRISRQQEVLAALGSSRALFEGDSSHALRVILERSAYVLGVDRASLWLFDETREHLHCQELYLRREERFFEMGEKQPISRPAYLGSLDQKRIIAINDVRSFHGCEHLAQAGIKSVLDAPLHILGELKGVVCFSSIELQRRWKLDEQSFAASISDLIAIVGELKERKRLQQALEQQSREARREMENEVRYSREFLRHVIDTDPNFIFVKDREGRFTLVNKAVADVYGTTISEIIGKTDAYFNDNEEEVAQFRADDIEVITSGCEKVIREERITDARGATRWLQTTKRPLALPDGTVQILGVSTDITERRALTEQLFQSQKMEAIGSLAGGIAHDFNNLLTAILGYVGFLKLRVGNEGEIADSVHKVEGIATKASQLTQKLLAFARKGKNQNISVDVHSLVNETIDILARTIESSVEIKLALDAKSAEVLGDPVQLQQVVLNLAINARDAMSPRVGGSSGGTLKIATRNITSERGFLSEGREYFSAGVAERERIPDGQYVEISVSDTGCGITESAMQRIFEPFFTTKGEGKGTGMGLAVVYGIVKNHGGIVTVKSTAGAGAHFKVYLPLEVRKSIDEVQSADVSEGSPIAGQGRILLVDDHSEIRDVTGQMLKHLGYRVVTASDGREAVEYMEGNSNVIDLVILDMTMPRLGGREAFKAIRKINPHVKTILSTGYLNTTYIEEILREGINGFMQKPYEMRRLSEVVAEVLR